MSEQSGSEIKPFVSPTPSTFQETARDYFVIQDGIPPDMYQQAELAVMKDQRLKTLYLGIQDIVAPYNQALHATAFFRSRFLQEQEALALPAPSPRPSGIGARLLRLLGEKSKKTNEVPTRVNRSMHWPSKSGDIYYHHALNFHEDLTVTPTAIQLDSYKARVGLIRGSITAALEFEYGPENRLRALSVSRVSSPTKEFTNLIPDPSTRQFVKKFTLPRQNDVIGIDPNSEYPSRSSASFKFTFDGDPSLAINVAFPDNYLGGDSSFLYNSSADEFQRELSGMSLITHKIYNLSPQGELSTGEYLDVLKSLISIVPLQKLQRPA